MAYPGLVNALSQQPQPQRSFGMGAPMERGPSMMQQAAMRGGAMRGQPPAVAPLPGPAASPTQPGGKASGGTLAPGGGPVGPMPTPMPGPQASPVQPGSKPASQMPPMKGGVAGY